MSNPTGNFIWYELMTDDIAASARFYAAVVGWSVADSGQPGMDYRLWHASGEAVGGLMALPEGAVASGMRPGWFGYINVDDVDACLAAIQAAGGSVRMPANDIPGIGRMAMAADPQGAAFYVMAPIGTDPSPAFAPGKPGHGGWHELHTTDRLAALEFYAGRFGWRKASEMDMGAMGTYVLFDNGGMPIGGMMNSPNFPRPAWLFYFGVDDIDAAKARVEAAGGQVLNGPMAVPGDAWIIQGQDPRGAMFALVGPKRS